VSHTIVDETSVSSVDNTNSAPNIQGQGGTIVNWAHTISSSENSIVYGKSSGSPSGSAGLGQGTN
jgi:hypothetical protein